MKQWTAPAIILLIGAAIVLGQASKAPLGVNYPGSSLEVNRTGDAIQALANGNVTRFFATQPAIGPVSVLVRAPFAALAGISHDLVPLAPRYHGRPALVMPYDFTQSQRRLYRFGLFPCLLALVILAAYAVSVLACRGRPLTTQLLTALLILGAPLWHSAITLGHPDEFLTTGLTLGAVLAAVNGRALPAAVLLGIALASKQWAVLAIPAVALAVPREEARKTVVLAIGVYLAFMIPMAIGNTDRFRDALTAPGTYSHGTVDTSTIWFPFASNHDQRVFDGVAWVTLPNRRLPLAFLSAMHPLIVVLAGALSLIVWRRRGSTTTTQDIFLLLALVFLLRCMLDPVTNDYYHLPFIASLALYEAFARQRLPVLTLIASAAFLPQFGSDALDQENLLYLAWSIPMAAWLAIKLYGRQPLLPPAPEAVGGRGHGA